MASGVRSTWRGSLKLSLIVIPVRAYPATRNNADVSFRQFHRRCKTRIQMRKWCPNCEIQVSGRDIIKGYEASRGRYVFVEKGEIDALRPDTSTTIAVSDVVDAELIDPRYIERVYYLAPDSKDAGEAFAVIRDALGTRAAIGRLSLHGREYLTAVVADREALRLYTLRTAGEVRSRDAIAPLGFASAKVKADEVKLARRVLQTFESDADLSSFVDNYQVALRTMLKKKGSGQAVEPVEADVDGGKVVNLMDALRLSLESARPKGRSVKKTTKPRRRRATVMDHPSRGKEKRAS